MRSFRFTIAKNMFANVMRGGASAVVAIVLPHFLTRALGHDRFAGWALMLQLAAYANYLDFGLQTAVARYLAGALERNDHDQCNRLVNNAIAILTVAGALALSGLAVAAWQLPHLFRSVPPSLTGELGLGLLILGVSAAINLPLSVYTGVLIGMQRNEFPAATMAISRLFGAVAVILTVHRTQSLVWLALCVAGFNLLAGIAHCVIVKRLLPTLRFSSAFLERSATLELIRYCSTLSIWSMGMLMVSGLDVTIVGLFNFPATGAYSIAATLILFFTGLIGAAFSAIMAPVAVLQARQEYSRIGRLMIVATRLNSYFSLGVVVVFFLFGGTLIRIWVGPSYLTVTYPVLKILLVAQAIRMVGNALGTVLVGMGLQRYGLVPVMIEGVLNLVLSLLGMIFIGPTGVAWATLIAAFIALTITITFVLQRVREISISRSDFIRQGIVTPFLPFVPVCGWILFRSWIGGIASATSRLAPLPAAGMSLLTIVLVSWSIASARRLDA
jgi:O-antigen/teichoic acid export membrane protein